MKIKIVNAMAPFIWGGAEELAFHLTRNLRLLGHEAELFRLPFNWEPYDQLPAEMARFKALRIDDADQVITLKFPTYLLHAENHITWLIHQYRQAYELWGTPYGNLPPNNQGREIRDLIQTTDTQVLGSRERLFTISDEVSRRLNEFNDIDAPSLKLPLNDPELFTGGADGGYLLAPGRVNSVKRQWLALEALALLPTGKLIIAGPAESEADANAMRQMVEKHGLEDRVKLDLRFMSRQELADYVNNARAVIYAPYQEDAFGYVTMEAYEAGKPVITASDSGAVTQLVRHAESGFIAPPEPQEFAEAMGRYLDHPTLAKEHGLAGRKIWRALDLTWPSLIDRLVGA